MRPTCHDCFRTESSGCMTLRIELREGRKSLARPAITVRVIEPWKMNSGSRDVRCVEFEIAEIVIDARRPAPDVAIPKIFCDSINAEQLHIAGRKRIQVPLKTHIIEDGIWGNVLRPARRENGLTLDVVRGGQIERDKNIVEVDRLSRMRINRRSKHKGNGCRQRIVLP